MLVTLFAGVAARFDDRDAGVTASAAHQSPSEAGGRPAEVGQVGRSQLGRVQRVCGPGDQRPDAVSHLEAAAAVSATAAEQSQSRPGPQRDNDVDNNVSLIPFSAYFSCRPTFCIQFLYVTVFTTTRPEFGVLPNVWA